MNAFQRRHFLPRARPLHFQRYTSTSTKPVSPHISFYTSFGRPIAKVFLSAICIYQITYWCWKKLEMDEVKREKNAEIVTLEKEIGVAKEKNLVGGR